MSSPTAHIPKQNWIAIAVAIAGLVAVAWWFWPSDSEEVGEDLNISSFEECVEAGYPVMESYPRQCRVPEKELFIEEVEDEIGAAYEDHVSLGGQIVRLTHPLSGDEIESPLQVAGEVRGSWSSGGSFPIELLDEEGEVISEGDAQLDSVPTTRSYTPFTAELEYDADETRNRLYLVLYKDNPSDNPDLDDSVEVAIDL